jgi:hypothetical protein
MSAIVIRGQAASPIGGHAIGSGSGTNQAIAPSVTLTKTDGTSMILEFYGQGETTWPSSMGAWGAAPAGYTQRAKADGASGFGPVASCLNTKNSTTSDGSVTQTSTTGSINMAYKGATIEILN